MNEWIVLAVLVAASYLPGRLIFDLFPPGESAGWRALEREFARLTLGVTAGGWLALVLVEAGRFSLASLATLWGGLVVAATVARWRQSRRLAVGGGPVQPEHQDPGGDEGEEGVLPGVLGRDKGTGTMAVAPELLGPARISFLPDWVEYAALAAWLALALWLFFRPHEMITGNGDAGVYVNLGAAIARNGSLIIQDEVLAAVDPALYPALMRPLPENPVAPQYILPGFFVIGTPAGEITPQYYPLHPVWLAIGYSLAGAVTTGVRAALLLPGLWALLGALALYLTVRQISGWPTALLALAALSLSALQVWFARYPTTESFTQYLLWSGIWSLGAWMSGRRPAALWGLLAGFTLGQAFLLRLDMLFALPLLLLLGVWLWRSGRWQRSGWLLVPLLFFLAHSLVHALWQSRPYFLELFGFAFSLARLYWWLVLLALLAVAAGATVIWIGGRRRRRGTGPGRRALASWRRPLLALAIVGILAWAIHGWFVRPRTGALLLQADAFSATNLPITNHENWLRLGWYLSPLGVWLGVAGICLMIWRLNRRTVVLLSLGLLFSTVYLWNLRANPHQIYAGRRFVPVIMPLFIAAAAIAIGWLAGGRGWVRVVAAIVAVAWLAGLGWSARGLVRQVDFKGITAQFAAFNDQLAPHSVFIFNDQSPVGQGDYWGAPLKFLYGHDVFSLRDPSQLNDDLLSQTIAGWQASGRTVYWVGEPAWLGEQGFAYEQSTVTIDSAHLEGRFDRKPEAVVPRTWTFNLAEIAP